MTKDLVKTENHRLIRLFVGIPISVELNQKILEWQGKQEYKLPVRWMEFSDLHVTLVAPWEVYSTDDIVAQLSTIEGKIHPFEIQFNEISYGPNLKQPRLIWVTGEVNAQVLALKNRLETLLVQPPDKRKFLPHITFARFSLSRLSPYPETIVDEQVNWVEQVRSIALYESIRKPQGSSYQIIAKFFL